MRPEWEIWLDNQLSSSLAKLMQIEFRMIVKSAFSLGNSKLKDKEIFQLAKEKGYVILLPRMLILQLWLPNLELHQKLLN